MLQQAFTHKNIFFLYCDVEALSVGLALCFSFILYLIMQGCEQQMKYFRMAEEEKQ